LPSAKQKSGGLTSAGFYRSRSLKIAPFICNLKIAALFVLRWVEIVPKIFAFLLLPSTRCYDPMKIHSLLSCFALFSLLLFAGCPTAPPQTPSSPTGTQVAEPTLPEESFVVEHGTPTPQTLPEPPVAPVVPVTPTEPPMTIPAPVTPPEPPAAPAATDPAPAPPASPQETPEEKIVRERATQLGGSIRKNAEGRIDRVIITNNDLTLADMQAIGKLTSLEWVRITGPSVTDEYVEAFNDLPNLKIVDISNSNITDKSLKMLKTHAEIHTLELQRNLQLSDQAVNLFAEFP
jgi:hypothetical protein